MRNKLGAACVAIVGCLSAAQGMAAPATVGELDEILSQTIIMQAKNRLQEAQAANDKVSRTESNARADAGAASVAGAAQTGGEQVPVSRLPRVMSIYGSDDALTAKLAYDARTVVEVHVGAALAGGEKVVAIDHDTVTVRNHDGKRVPLAPYLGAAQEARLSAHP